MLLLPQVPIPRVPIPRVPLARPPRGRRGRGNRPLGFLLIMIGFVLFFAGPILFFIVFADSMGMTAIGIGIVLFFVAFGLMAGGGIILSGVAAPEPELPQTPVEPARQVVTHVNVDLNKLIEQARQGGITEGFTCPTCHAPITLAEATSLSGVKTCRYCGAAIKTTDVVDFLTGVLDQP